MLLDDEHIVKKQDTSYENNESNNEIIEKTVSLESTKKAKTNGGAKSKQSNKPRRYSVLKEWGESAKTTGYVRERSDGRYDYYWYNPTMYHRSFSCPRDDVEDCKNIQKEWIECGYDAKQWKKIIGRNGGKTVNPEHRNIYSDGKRYTIEYNHTRFGSVRTLEQAIWIRTYLAYNGWNMKFSYKNLGISRCTGDKYYEKMKYIIMHDKAYLKREE